MPYDPLKEQYSKENKFLKFWKNVASTPQAEKDAMIKAREGRRGSMVRSDPSRQPYPKPQDAAMVQPPRQQPGTAQAAGNEPPLDLSYRNGNKVPTPPRPSQTVAPSVDTVAEPPMDTSYRNTVEPTTQSETSGAPRGTTRIPAGSGGSKQGTGNILLTNQQGNPNGEIVGDLSGFKARQAARRQPNASGYGSSAAETRFRNAVQPGGRGRSARRPGFIVQEPQRQPTVQEEVGPLNTLSDYIREGAKLKARKTQSDIREARDRTKEAQERTEIDRRKAEVDAQSAPSENRERRARADSYEADARLNTIKADLQQRFVEAESDEERNAIAQQMQQLNAYKPTAERSTGEMNENQRANLDIKAREKYNEWKVTNPDREETYDQWLQTTDEGAVYNKYLTEGGGETAYYPKDPAQREEGKEYNLPDGRRVKWVNGKTQLVE